MKANFDSLARLAAFGIALFLFSGWMSLPGSVAGQEPARSQAVHSQSTAAGRLNRVIEVFEQGEAAFGIFASDFSTRRAAAVASSPLDFVILDMEHAPYDVTRLESYLLALIDKRRVLQKASLQPDVIPVVRIPSNAREPLQFIIKQVLDLGAFGVVVPHVESREQAVAIVRAARYPQGRGLPDRDPAGQRGVGYGWAARYWGLAASEYAEKADLWPLDPRGELLVWCMIESETGARNAREIAATPGVGGIFVGPSDLAFSLGVSPDDPALEVAMLEILQACKRAQTPCGTICSTDSVRTRLDQGFQFLALGSDAGLPGDVRQALDTARKKP